MDLFFSGNPPRVLEMRMKGERPLYPRVVVSRRLNNPFPWFKAGKLPCSEAERRNLFRLARLVTQRNTLERNDAWQRRRFLKEAATSEPSSKTIKGRPGAVKKKKEKEDRSRCSLTKTLSPLEWIAPLKYPAGSKRRKLLFRGDGSNPLHPCSAFHQNRIINRTRQTVLLRLRGRLSIHYVSLRLPRLRLENDWRVEGAWNKLEQLRGRYSNIENIQIVVAACAKIYELVLQLVSNIDHLSALDSSFAISTKLSTTFSKIWGFRVIFSS